MNVPCHCPTVQNLHRIGDNDPQIRGLALRSTDWDQHAESTDWTARVGHVIGQSIHLRRLEIWIDHPFELLTEFFKHLAWNQSIWHLVLNVSDLSSGELELLLNLIPFLKHNPSLLCIEMGACSENMSTIFLPFLASALSQSLPKHLKRIDLFDNEISDEDAFTFIKAVNDMPVLCSSLLELCLARNSIGRRGCTALCELLKNAATKLQCIDLMKNHIDDECIDILISPLTEKNTVEELNLSMQGKVSVNGWIAFSSILSNPHCSLETIDLGENRINNIASTSLGEALVGNSTLKTIRLSNSIHTGWQGFSSCLRSPRTAIQEIDLQWCQVIDDDGAAALFAALAVNSTVETLVMTSNNTITASGWITCLRLLVNSNSPLALAEMYLGHNNIDDEGSSLMVDLLSKISTVTSLHLDQETPSITANGWRALVDVLQPNSLSKLERLSIGGDPLEVRINKEVIIAIAEALVYNESLDDLSLNRIPISEGGWDALSLVLCNVSSILSTFNSNHTLENIKAYGEVPIVVQTLLRLNDNVNKASVARTKILMHHFSDKDPTCVHNIFGPMALTLVPTAISWVGRDRKTFDFSVMYHFVHSVPWLSK